MPRRCRFVQPSTRRLELTEGYWIEVKDRLSVGERRDAMQASASAIKPDGTYTPNLSMAGIAEIAAYLVDWNLTDAQNKIVDIDAPAARIAALRALDRDTFNEIDTAIETHVVAMTAAETAEKKTRDGETRADETLPSVV